ncbi:MAG: ABC transporter permease [Candidatus Aminicenantes bacterium]|nr:ABC transporter permease [Candidatus Aminicenantes bacterium]
MKNDLKFAFRMVRRHKVISLVNILGLAIGLSACFLMMVYVVNETRYEDFQANGERIYRIALEWGQKGSRMKFAGTMPALGPAVAAEFPEVESAVRVQRQGDVELRAEPGAPPVQAATVLLADPDFFAIFSYTRRPGFPQDPLREPFAAVASASLARAVWGTEDAVGRSVLLDERALKITGVMDDAPANTHLRPDLVVSYATLEALTGRPSPGWSNWGMDRTYVLFRGKPDILSFQEKLKGLLKKNVDPAMAEMFLFHLHPLKRLHWITDFRGDLYPRGNRSYFYMFIWAAVFVLAVACFNFVNLTSSQNLERMQEVGVRHVLGATRSRVLGQFLRESLVTLAAAVVIGAAVLQMAFRPMMAFIGAPVVLTKVHLPYLAGVFALILLAAVAAGLVPAGAMSRFNPAQILGKGRNRPRPVISLRKALFALQFVITIVLFIATLVIYRQMKFVLNSDLGFNKNDVLLIPVFGRDARFRERYEVVRRELERNPAILGVSSTDTTPGVSSMSNMTVFPGRTDLESGITVQSLGVDDGFIDTLGLTLVAGRGFARGSAGDAAIALLLNESAVRVLGFKEPVGAHLKIPRGEQLTEMTVVGVVKDFHVQPLHYKINPMAIALRPGRGVAMLIRYRSGQKAAVLEFVRRTLKELMPEETYEIRFLDREYAKGYLSEQKTGTLLAAFSLLAVLISCAGLLGLTAFTVGRRIKEIGIRKVLGASSGKVIFLLAREYLVIVLAANIIAWPVAAYAMGRWLRNFAYRIEFGVLTFILAGTLALLVAALTVGAQAARAARTNPVDCLRYE